MDLYQLPYEIIDMIIDYVFSGGYVLSDVKNGAEKLYGLRLVCSES